MKLRLFLAITLVALAGCASTPPRYVVPKAEPGERIGIGFRTVEVRRVTLPSYASLSEIFVEGEDGSVVEAKSAIWADEPDRAITLELTRALGQITGAKVASEPWPFDALPQVRVEVRIEDMLARRDGQFVLSGQYFVAALDGSSRDRAKLFDIAAPIAEEGGAAAIARARGETVQALAREIARSGLR